MNLYFDITLYYSEYIYIYYHSNGFSYIKSYLSYCEMASIISWEQEIFFNCSMYSSIYFLIKSEVTSNHCEIILLFSANTFVSFINKDYNSLA